MKLSLSVSAAALALAVATPAAAQKVDQDVRCLLLSNSFTRLEKDAGRKLLADAAGLYYFGRVDTRLSGEPLRQAIVEQSKLLNATNAGPLMTECARQMQTRRQALQSIGKSLAPPAKK